MCPGLLVWQSVSASLLEHSSGRLQLHVASPRADTGLSQRSPPLEPGLVEQDRLPLQRRYVALCRWCPGLPPPCIDV